MATYFIIDQDTFDNTDWRASPTWILSPRPLEGGQYEGKYKIGLGIYTDSTSGLSSAAGKERITMVKVYMRRMNGGTPCFLCSEFNTLSN